MSDQDEHRFTEEEAKAVHGCFLVGVGIAALFAAGAISILGLTAYGLWRMVNG